MPDQISSFEGVEDPKSATTPTVVKVQKTNSNESIQVVQLPRDYDIASEIGKMVVHAAGPRAVPKANIQLTRPYSLAFLLVYLLHFPVFLPY